MTDGRGTDYPWGRHMGEAESIRVPASRVLFRSRTQRRLTTSLGLDRRRLLLLCRGHFPMSGRRFEIQRANQLSTGHSKRLRHICLPKPVASDPGRAIDLVETCDGCGRTGVTSPIASQFALTRSATGLAQDSSLVAVIQDRKNRPRLSAGPWITGSSAVVSGLLCWFGC